MKLKVCNESICLNYNERKETLCRVFTMHTYASFMIGSKLHTIKVCEPSRYLQVRKKQYSIQTRVPPLLRFDGS